MPTNIKGGYYIKARKIQNSLIATCPPHIREIWDWILKEANHKDNVSSGRLIKRGECVRTYDDIRDGLKWSIGWRVMKYSKWDCEGAMKKLRTLGMITTKKTTRGMLITVLKYDFYQDPKNYESHTDNHNESHTPPQTRHTINNNDNNDKNEKNIYYLSNIPIKDIEEFTTNLNCSEYQIKSKAEDLVNYCKANGKNYKDYKAFLRNALKRDFGAKKPQDQAEAQRIKETQMKYTCSSDFAKQLALRKTI